MVYTERRGLPDYSWGWYASPTLDHQQFGTRGPALVHPKNIFAAIRGQRKVCIENASPRINQQVAGGIYYKLLHMYNVDGMKSTDVFDRKNNQRKPGAITFVDFSTKAEQEDAIQKFDGYNFHGHKLRISISKPPKQFPWERHRRHAGRNSGRDLGSAADTNFEAEEERMLRKWILRHNDRSLWI